MYNLWFIAIVLVGLSVGIGVLHIALKDHYDFCNDKNFSLMLNVVTFALLSVVTIALVKSIVAIETVNELIMEHDLLVKLLEVEDGLDRIAITERVMKYNHQVTKIISQVNTLGDWSPYTFTDYELLTFIEI